MSSESEDEELQSYSIVRFIHKGRRKKFEQIDVVPTNWVRWDKKKGKLIVKYLAPDANSEDYNTLHNLVKISMRPPDSWPDYTIEIVGRAKSCQESLLKLERLQKEDNVLTQSDDDISAKQKKIEIAIKQRQLKDAALAMEGDILSDFAVGDGARKTKSDKLATNNIDHSGKETNPNMIVTRMESSFEVDIPVLDPSSHLMTNPPNVDLLNIHLPFDLDAYNIESHTQQDNAIQNSGKANGEDNPSLSQNDAGTADGLNRDSHITGQIGTLNDNSDLDLATLQFQNIKCNNDFEQAVFNCLKLLDFKLNQMMNFLSDKKVVNLDSSNVNLDKYNIKLPLSSVAEFESFNEKLENDQFLLSDVNTIMKTCMDKDFIVTRSLCAMMKKFLTKHLALQYTAARKCRNKDPNLKKEIFKNTTLCKRMFTMITAKRISKKLEISEKDLISSLSDVFCNMKSWAE